MADVTIRGLGNRSDYIVDFDGPIVGSRETEKGDENSPLVPSKAQGTVEQGGIDIWVGPLPVTVDNLEKVLANPGDIEVEVGDRSEVIQPGESATIVPKDDGKIIGTLVDAIGGGNKVEVDWEATNFGTTTSTGSFNVIAGDKATSVELTLAPREVRRGTEEFEFGFGSDKTIQVCVSSTCREVDVQGTGVSTNGDCDNIVVKQKPQNGGGGDDGDGGIIGFISDRPEIVGLGLAGLGVGLVTGGRDGQ